MKKMLKFAALSLALAVSGVAMANEITPAKTVDAKTAILAKMARVFGGVEVTSVTKVSEVVDKTGLPVTAKDSSVFGLYEVKLASGVRAYTDATGSYWLISRQGLDLLSTPNDHDIINVNGIADRGDTLKAMQDIGKTVEFKAPNEKTSITIFFDVQCGFCHKMFDERQTYLDKGISLKFAAAAIFPGSREVMGKIWCSPNDKKDLIAYEAYQNDRHVNPDAKLKAPEVGDGKTSCEDLIDKQSNIAKKVGLTGTPLIITSTGDKIAGYKSADELAKQLGL